MALIAKQSKENKQEGANIQNA